jgi:hypothetical protein
MVPELRARGIGETLDVAVSLYRARFGRLIGLAAIVVVPVQVLTVLVLLSAQPDRVDVNVFGNTSPQYNTKNAFIQLAASLSVIFIGYVSNAFVVGLCARPAGDEYVGEQGTWKRGSVGGRGFAAVLGAAILVALCEIGGFFVCGVGYFVAITFFAVAMPACVLERITPGRAIGRSFSLTKTHFFRVLGAVITAQLLSSVLNIGLTALIAVVFRNSSTGSGRIIAQGFASAASASLTAPFIAAVAVAIYFDCRIRDEAFDVQLLMQRNDARYADATPAPA